MKIGCPVCGAQYDLDGALNDIDSKKFVALIADMQPSLARALIRYLGLWRPLKRGLRWPKMLKEARELAPMMAAEQMIHKRHTYAVPVKMWVTVMNEMAERPDNLTLPLTHHHYLLQVLANQAEKVEAKVEAIAEKKKQTPKRKGTGAPVAMREMVNKIKQRGGGDE